MRLMEQAKPKETVPVQAKVKKWKFVAEPDRLKPEQKQDYLSLDYYLEIMRTTGAREIARQSIVREEGIRYFPYTDIDGYYTIGIGHLLEDQKAAHDDWMITKEGGIHAKGWTSEKCYSVLADDLTKAIGASLQWWSKDVLSLSMARRAVIAEMCFVLGYHGAREFHHFKEHYLAGDVYDSARELIESDWDIQAPHRVERLAKRWELG